jgi:glycosyltransferase involved in cell wall biosynthesis
MIEKLLQGSFDRIELHHVRLAFSDDMESVGKFAFRKVFILFSTIFSIWAARFRTGAKAMYYPPSGPNKVPVFRDIILLCCTRWLFTHTIFHFHAGGVTTFRTQLPGLLRPFYDLAYRNSSLAIRTAVQNPDDGQVLGAKRSVVVPNGIEDMRGRVPERIAAAGEPIVVLFTGVLIPSKGVRVLLEAFNIAIAAGAHLQLQLMGKWGDVAFEKECLDFIGRNGLNERVSILGVKQHEEKFSYFAACDIFCFPSYFEAESFGLVLVEAMQFAKPVISTRWRGIPSVVEDGRNGFLVPVKDAEAVADRLRLLAADAELRARMGREGRRIFEEKFTLEAFHRSMEKELASVFEA